MMISLDNTRDIFIKLILPMTGYNTFAVLYRKNGMDMDLCIGIWHSI